LRNECPVLLFEVYLLESHAVYSKVSFWISSKIRHMSTQSCLISRSAGLITIRSTGVAYLQCLYVASLVMISISSLRLHRRWYLQNV